VTQQRVVVVGSYNTDMIIKTPRLPRPGETVLGGTFSSGPGGKGANQAVSAARAGADVCFIARLGGDTLGDEALSRLRTEKVRTDHIVRDPGSPTGTAWIVVDDRGENCIVVASGANARLSPSDVLRGEAEIASADVVLMQLESPLDAVEMTLEIASRHGVRVILNPAPALPLSPALLSRVSVITPNEVEAEMLTGVKIEGEASHSRAADRLLAMGIGTVVITLGSRGVYVASSSERFHLPAFRVEAVDTTAAGDVFNGCLAAFLDPAGSLKDVVRASSAGAAISVTKLGAQDSAPSREAIDEFLNLRRHAQVVE
jgi:ribokinase